MLHHVSFTANDPRGVAEVLAYLIDGKVSRFGPIDGGFIAWAPDVTGTAIEVYPRGTEILPGPGTSQATFTRNLFAQQRTATHAAISVERSEAEVYDVARRHGWPAAVQNRGGFNVIELWVEDTVMLEIFTPAMLQQYLSVVQSPHVPARGSDIGSIQMKVRVATDPSTAFRAWTSGPDLQAWWPVPQARIDLRVGGPIELTFLPEAPVGTRGTEGSRFLSYLPNRMVSFTWTSPPHLKVRGAQTWVVLEFEPVDGGTDINMTQSGFMAGPEWDECRTYFQQAWRRVLRRMAEHWSGADVDLRAHIPAPKAAVDITEVSRAAAR